MYNVEQLIKILSALPSDCRVVICCGDSENAGVLESVDHLKGEHSKTGEVQDVVMLWTSYSEA